MGDRQIERLYGDVSRIVSIAMNLTPQARAKLIAYAAGLRDSGEELSDDGQPTTPAISTTLLRVDKRISLAFSPDEALIARQRDAEAAEAALASALVSATHDAATEIFRDWPSFLAGASISVDASIGVGYRGDVTWADDIRPTLARAMAPDDLANLEGKELHLPGAPLVGDLHLADVILGVLKERGVIKGPCEECGRALWVPPYRAASRGGRPRICDTLCPSCETAHSVRRDRAKAKAYADRKAQGEAGEPAN